MLLPLRAEPMLDRRHRFENFLFQREQRAGQCSGEMWNHGVVDLCAGFDRVPRYPCREREFPGNGKSGCGEMGLQW